VILGALAAAVLLLGIWPAPLLDVMGVTVEHLLEQMMSTKL
jgi:NADH-quinone oxidoreductase subunit M